MVPDGSGGGEGVDVTLMTERDLEMLPTWELREIAQRPDLRPVDKEKIQNVLMELARGIGAGPSGDQLDGGEGAKSPEHRRERAKSRGGRASTMVRRMLQAMKMTDESDDEEDSDDEDLGGSEPSKGKGLRMKLLYTHRNKPGHLAKLALGEIIELTGAAYTMDFKAFDHLGHFRPNKISLHELPPLFRSYAMRLDMRTNLRSRREVDTVAMVLDLLVQRKVGEAADILVQRLKALEQAHTEGTWERAQWHELLAPTNASRASREDLAGAARESMTEKKMQTRDRFAPNPRNPNPDKDRKKPDKDGKGKGKGKGESAPDPVG